MRADPPRLPALEMTTALHRGVSMVRRERAEELSDESRALRAEASIARGRSVALLRASRDRRSAERGARR